MSDIIKISIMRKSFSIDATSLHEGTKEELRGLAGELTLKDLLTFAITASEDKHRLLEEAERLSSEISSIDDKIVPLDKEI